MSPWLVPPPVSGGWDSLGLGSAEAGPVGSLEAEDGRAVGEGRDGATEPVPGDVRTALPQAPTASAIAGTTSSHRGQ